MVIDRAWRTRFSTLSDDGSEFEVDGSDSSVSERRAAWPAGSRAGGSSLAAGIHPVRLRYGQAGGGFALALNYARGDDRSPPIPSTRLTARTRFHAEPIGSDSADSDRRGDSAPGAALDRGIACSRPAWAAGVDVIDSRYRSSIARGRRWQSRIVIARSHAHLHDARIEPRSCGATPTFSSRRLATSGRASSSEHDPFRTLLYPYFLTAFHDLERRTADGSSDRLARSVYLGVIAAMAFFAAGRPRSARIALAGHARLASHGARLFYENSILSEAFFGCVALSLSVILGLRRSRSVPQAIAAAGGVSAMMTMTRPVAVVIVIIPIATR